LCQLLWSPYLLSQRDDIEGYTDSSDVRNVREGLLLSWHKQKVQIFSLIAVKSLSTYLVLSIMLWHWNETIRSFSILAGEANGLLSDRNAGGKESSVDNHIQRMCGRSAGGGHAHKTIRTPRAQQASHDDRCEAHKD